MALMNRQLAPEIETFFIVTDPQYSYLSSSAVRNIFRLGSDCQGMVPPGVSRRLRERFPFGFSGA
jgi:pantetheine-phosphate adenylyltransferase